MKRFVIFMCLILCLGTICFAASENVSVTLNKKIKVMYNDELQEFQNVNGVRVYPLSYEGTTYLPIRAISSLFSTEIRWDGETKSVFIGEGELDTTSAKVAEEFVEGENEKIDVLRNEDIKVYYYGEVQTFTDVNGKVVFPLSYEGTTYLPVRAISNLFDATIDWDGENNTIIINEFVEPADNPSGDDFSGELYSGDDEELNVNLEDDEEAIEISDIHSFVDEEGTETYYYFDENGDARYFYFDEDGDVVNFYYDIDGNVIYYYDEEVVDLYL